MLPNRQRSSVEHKKKNKKNNTILPGSTTSRTAKPEQLKPLISYYIFQLSRRLYGWQFKPVGLSSVLSTTFRLKCLNSQCMKWAGARKFTTPALLHFTLWPSVTFFLAHQHFSRVAGTLLRWRAPLVADIFMFCLPAFLSPCLKYFVDPLKAAHVSQQSCTGHWEHTREFLVLLMAWQSWWRLCEMLLPPPHPYFPEQQHVSKERTGTCLFFFPTTSTVINYNMSLYYRMCSYWFLYNKSQKVNICWWQHTLWFWWRCQDKYWMDFVQTFMSSSRWIVGTLTSS